MAYQFKSGRTIEARRELYSEFARNFNKWIKMSDVELFREVKHASPGLRKANRDECIMYLAMDHVERMIGDK